MERYEIKFLGDDKKKFEIFALKLAKDTQGKLARQMDQLEKFGPDVPFPIVRKISQGLWELRIRGRQEIRVLYVIRMNKVWFLNWFVKKTNEIPAREMEKSLRRLREI